MRRVLYITGYIVLIAGFVVAVNSILEIYLLQLRLQVQREQLHNYELSSRMLEARFRNLRGNKDNYKDEIRMSILETGVMNKSLDSDLFSLTPYQYLGYIIVNTVRRISFRPFMKLEEDREFLFLLQYAFYLERQRRFVSASDKYIGLEKMLKDSRSEDSAFIYLHNGYSLALLGKDAEAIKRLDFVIAQNRGTHYQQTASLIKRLILEAENSKSKIDSGTKNPEKLLRDYYQAGLYSDAVKVQDKIKNKNDEILYFTGRSYEEMGQVHDAMEVYIDIINKDINSVYAKKANKRMLLIGHFYGGGAEVQKYSVKVAKEQKDEEILEDITDAKGLQLESSVVKKIEEEKNSVFVSSSMSEVLNTYNKDLNTENIKIEKINKIIEAEDKSLPGKDEVKLAVNDVKEKTPALKDNVKDEKNVKGGDARNGTDVQKEVNKDEAVPDDSSNKELPDFTQKRDTVKVLLKDGRSLHGEVVTFEQNGRVSVKNGRFYIAISANEISKIFRDKNKDVKFEFNIDGKTRILEAKEMKIFNSQVELEGWGRYSLDSLNTVSPVK